MFFQSIVGCLPLSSSERFLAASPMMKRRLATASLRSASPTKSESRLPRVYVSIARQESRMSSKNAASRFPPRLSAKNHPRAAEDGSSPDLIGRLFDRPTGDEIDGATEDDFELVRHLHLLEVTRRGALGFEHDV